MKHPDAARTRSPLLVTAAMTLLCVAAHGAPQRKPNHLIGEKSPYLLQHAYNPVEWYPWSEAAFAKARN